MRIPEARSAQRTGPRSAIAALLAVMLLLLAACSAGSGNDAPPSSSGGAVAATGNAQTSKGRSGLPTVALTSLPAQARQTHALILDGGPYPYPQDDAVFGNREGILPDEEYGWYREYTVPTPGSPDRGARRFVVGDDEIFFYTDDHYASFREVVR